MWRELNKAELALLYHEKMTRDFPAEELKPLSRLMHMQVEGHYHVLVWEDAGVLQAYACIYTGQRLGLLDYFAVLPVWRGHGIGSRALMCQLTEQKVGRTLLVELEDPAAAANAADMALRLRRIRFYERLGFSDSGVRALIFGVRYRVFHGLGRADACTVAQALTAIYRYFVPNEDLYAKQIFVSLPDEAQNGG